jgi:hypothetical protein
MFKKTTKVYHFYGAQVLVASLDDWESLCLRGVGNELQIENKDAS